MKNNKRRIFLYGAGVVAPGAQNLDEFLEVVRKGQSVLTPKESLAACFLAGIPKFDFSLYKNWLTQRLGPKRYPILNEKNGDLVKFSVGSLIDILEKRPALEQAIHALNPRIIIQYATGLADLPVIQKAGREYDKTLFEWNAFWTQPTHNAPLRDHLNGTHVNTQAPPPPQQFAADTLERFEALKAWNAFWAEKSPVLKSYLSELSAIETQGVPHGDIELAKLNLIRTKAKARKELEEKYRAPKPPWEGVSSNLLWNIPNIAASQISMLLGIQGPALGLSAACGSFGAVLYNAINEIRDNRCDLAIIGAVDATPADELISAFYGGRLAALGSKPSVPFCDLRGTHISGGVCTWILSTQEVMDKFNLQPLGGVEILGAGLSSDAEHIITPSKEGPKRAIRAAFQSSDVEPKDIQLWDMHATATPGDWNEFHLVEEFVPATACYSARKGIFGHGMAASGGWELTAQLLGVERTTQGLSVPPAGIPPSELNSNIAALGKNLVLDHAVTIPKTKGGVVCGKLSMGVGGVSSCIVSRIHT